jgi:hypothetical protein
VEQNLLKLAVVLLAIEMPIVGTPPVAVLEALLLLVRAALAVMAACLLQQVPVVVLAGILVMAAANGLLEQVAEAVVGQMALRNLYINALVHLAVA